MKTLLDTFFIQRFVFFYSFHVIETTETSFQTQTEQLFSSCLLHFSSSLHWAAAAAAGEDGAPADVSLTNILIKLMNTNNY